MSKKAKKSFNKESQDFKKMIAGVASSLVLMGTAAPATGQEATTQPARPDAFAEPTYWQHPQYDVIVRVERDHFTNGLNATVHSIDPNDRDVRSGIAQLEGRYRERRGGGSPGQHGGHMRVLDTRSVTDNDILNYSQYRAGLNLRENTDGTWEGTAYSPYNYRNYEIKVRPQENGQLRITITIPELFNYEHSERVNRVETPPPATQPHNRWFVPGPYRPPAA